MHLLLSSHHYFVVFLGDYCCFFVSIHLVTVLHIELLLSLRIESLSLCPLSFILRLKAKYFCSGLCSLVRPCSDTHYCARLSGHAVTTTVLLASQALP